ncbi:Glycine/D-amino acid oxidase [Limimonas halophila]|uniref:Glycine/D-amino acid oxidase n=1 Tax=Limimonas halophila TaxID=1082479 RepID=A0A1G7S299_9PROT|nr:FAD-binding oxidoreductase [Limimonas halophila]SDG16579.1 Glycine/D-amino acid oxidase [Limimonas halophila]
MSAPRSQPTAALPASVGVAVIGGGIAGASLAFELARRGHSVALLEKGRVGAEQSSRNWGWCRQQGRDHRELPLIQESLRQWDALTGTHGADTGFRRAGIVKVAESREQLAGLEAAADLAARHGIRGQLLSAEQARELVPGLQGRVVGGLHTPDDGVAEPARAAPAIADAAARHGAHVREGCAVRGLDVAAGAVRGVVTEHGRVAADAVVCAGGAWSRLLCQRHGVALPQLTVRATAFRTPAALDVSRAGAVGLPGVSLRRRGDGGHTVGVSASNIAEITPATFMWLRSFWPGFRMERPRLKLRVGRAFLDAVRTPRRWDFDRPSPFEATRVLDPAPDWRGLRDARARLARRLPALAGIEAAEAWAGAIDATPDAVPAIGPVPGLPGLHLATGFSGHGFGLGPGAGRLAADLVTAGDPVVDPSPYRIERFFDGTRLVPESGI